MSNVKYQCCICIPCKLLVEDKTECNFYNSVILKYKAGIDINNSKIISVLIHYMGCQIWLV